MKGPAASAGNWPHQNQLPRVHKSNSLSILLASDEIRDIGAVFVRYKLHAMYRQAGKNYNMAISNNSATAKKLSSRAIPSNHHCPTKANLLLLLYLAHTQQN